MFYYDPCRVHRSFQRCAHFHLVWNCSILPTRSFATVAQIASRTVNTTSPNAMMTLACLFLIGRTDHLRCWRMCFQYGVVLQSLIAWFAWKSHMLCNCWWPMALGPSSQCNRTFNPNDALTSASVYCPLSLTVTGKPLSTVAVAMGVASSSPSLASWNQ